MIWLLRLSLVVLVAAGMALVGFSLLPGSFAPGRQFWAAAISAALWLCLCPLVYRQGLGMAIVVGLLSPLIAAAPFSPLLVFAAFVDVRYGTVFLTGAVTGVLVWACLSIGLRDDRGKSKRTAARTDEFTA
jgi:hypothetical protein